MAAIAQTAHPLPRLVPVVAVLGAVVEVCPDLPDLEPSPEDCVECGQTAVAFDPHGLGWCTAHAPLELL